MNVSEPVNREIDNIVGELTRQDPFRVWRTAVDNHIAAADPEFVVALARASAPKVDPDLGRALLDSAFRSLLGAQVPGKVTAALHVVAVMRPTKRRVRHLAALLAGLLDADDAVTAFLQAGAAGPIAEELRACLLHELLFRGVTVTELDPIARWTASPHWARHPLRPLPLQRTDFEHDLPIRHYSGNGSSVALPFDTDPTPALSRHTRIALPRARETTTPESTEQLEQAVANWKTHSNGRIEARTFALTSIPDPATAAAVLETLPLACLQARHPAATDLVVTPSTPARVWRILFAAAANGGAYNSGEGVGYGRLAAWQSLAALCGATDIDTIAAITRRANDARWFTFSADTPWFERIAWDLGVFAITPDPSVSVLAATDTD
ncbi:DUF6183 family protein [Nocardia sp. NPDC060259]|uniref:DUF6183 family protein n=1 Tax=Nocardia sp. NPDC060259 TaxID=3347088 RepID=UPI0036661C0D